MADDDLRAQLEEAERRAQSAEARLRRISEAPARLVGLGVPSELAHMLAEDLCDRSDEEVGEWVGHLEAYCETTTEREFAERGLRVGGSPMVVRNAPVSTTTRQPRQPRMSGRS
jgi:hypothetical protein